jgi:hypothetical protein
MADPVSGVTPMLSSSALNPFLLLMDPSSVLRAVESSTSLCSLKARVFRPLEPDTGAELAAYDAAIETEPEIGAEMAADAAEQVFGALEPQP